MAGSTNGANGAYPGAEAENLDQTGPPMSEDEIALYDRQIRLWGMRAQEKIRSAHVLLVTMRALGNEIAKNLVLAGVGTLTIADHENVTEADLGAQFLLATPAAGDLPGENATDAERREAADRAAAAVVGTNRAVAASLQLRAMNPRVNVIVEQGDVRTKGPSFYQPFSLIIVTDLDPNALKFINTASRLVDRPFYAASTYGYYGFLFADLIEHEFMIVRDRGNIATEKGTQETRTRTIVDVRAQAGEGGEAKSSNSGPEKEVVTKREMYSTWYLASDVSPLPASIKNTPRRLRNVSPYLPCLRALWVFQERHAGEGYRLPDLQSAADVRSFTELVSEKQKILGTPEVKPDNIRGFLQGVSMREISPVVTMLGGQLAQDVINTLGHAQQPIQNLLVFDGFTLQSSVYALHPDGILGRSQLTTAPRSATAKEKEAVVDMSKADGADTERVAANTEPESSTAHAVQPTSKLTLTTHAPPPS